MATCTASVPDLNASGDNLYGPRICWQAFIDWAWDAFDFDKGDWDDGFGYDQVCDNTRPLCRTLSGIYCLTYSSPNFPREFIRLQHPGMGLSLCPQRHRRARCSLWRWRCHRLFGVGSNN